MLPLQYHEEELVNCTDASMTKKAKKKKFEKKNNSGSHLCCVRPRNWSSGATDPDSFLEGGGRTIPKKASEGSLGGGVVRPGLWMHTLGGFMIFWESGSQGL